MRYINEALGGVLGGGISWAILREFFPGTDLGMSMLAGVITTVGMSALWSER